MANRRGATQPDLELLDAIRERCDTLLWAQACITEAFNVARAKGIAIDIEDPVAYLQGYGERMPNGFPSTAQDHAARKKGEIDAINGAIPRVGAEVGVGDLAVEEAQVDGAGDAG